MKILNRKNVFLLIAIVLIAVLLIVFRPKRVPAAPAEAAAAESVAAAEPQPQPTRAVSEEVTAEGICEISKYGNVKIALPHARVLEAFEYGDILTVRFGGISVDVPLGKSFSDVDSGCPGLFLQMDGETEETELAVNMGNFAEAYGIAKKIVHEDKSYEWQYCDGMSDKTVFTLTLKEKAGYLEQFTIRSMTYTDLREDYPALSDAEFANFRPVTAGQIGDGVLFRSASPIDPERKRSTCADAAAAEAGVTVFIDLTDNEEAISKYEGVENSYFAAQKHIAVAASMDFTTAENREKLAEAFRYMAAEPGVYCIFCGEGKERTGTAVAVLESLMGAGYDEIKEDYMQSFVNYYKIGPADAVYGMTVNGNLNRNLTVLFGIDPTAGDLQQAAEKYLASIGLTAGEIAGLKNNLKG